MDKRITIYIDDERYKEIQRIAQKEDRSVSNMIDVIFKEYIINFNNTMINKNE